MRTSFFLLLVLCSAIALGTSPGDPPPGVDDGWLDLRAALPGAAGVPQLVPTGAPSSRTTSVLRLTDAAPSAPAALVAGLVRIDTEFKGGTLVPLPEVIFTSATDPRGELDFELTWPQTLPGLTLYLQAWIVDDSNPLGWSSSNALAALVFDLEGLIPAQ